MAIISLSSSKKDYTCTCTVASDTEAWGVGGVEIQAASSSTASSSSVINDKKDDAEASCTAGSSTINDGGTPLTILTTVCVIAD